MCLEIFHETTGIIAQNIVSLSKDNTVKNQKKVLFILEINSLTLKQNYKDLIKVVCIKEPDNNLIITSNSANVIMPDGPLPQFLTIYYNYMVKFKEVLNNLKSFDISQIDFDKSISILNEQIKDFDQLKLELISYLDNNKFS